MNILGPVLLGAATAAVAAALLRTAVRALKRTGRPGWEGSTFHSRYLAAALGGVLLSLLATDQPLHDRLLPACLAWFGASAAHYLLGPATPRARTATTATLGALAVATAVLA